MSPISTRSPAAPVRRAVRLVRHDVLQGPAEEALEQEWLLTNRRGAFCSSTIIGCPTRKYHGLLIAPIRPPLQRNLLLAGLIECVSHGEDRMDLSTFEFPGVLHPEGHRNQTRFESCPGDPHPWVRFTYRHGSLDVRRRITLSRSADVVRVDYQVRAPDQRPLRLEVSPLIAMRDLHGLRHQAAEDPWTLQATESSLWVRCTQSPEMTLALLGWSGGELTQPQLALEPVWWHNFRYRVELSRGYAGGEDLQSAGTFHAEGRGTLSVSIRAVGYPSTAKKARSIARDAFKDESHASRTAVAASTDDPIREALMTAGDQFVVARAARRGKKSAATILAGYPWFGDWGRDAFISLEGVLLIPGRFAEAREVLATFAAAQRNGLIPNRFDDYGGENAYNSVDASLWFVHAAEAYLRYSADAAAWDGFLKEACLSVIRHYVDGTDFGIGVDQRGLVRCGDDSTQLTWMDAKVGDTPVTPRSGCPVEVNALWYSILRGVASRMAGTTGEELRLIGDLITRIEANFAAVFWNETDGCLFDFVNGDWCDAAIRPNQIFAVGLPYSPLDGQRQKAVVDVVRSHLLTPFGLRTLSQSDSRYRGIHKGNSAERDRAYHNGTVWPWLIGRFVEAFLRVNNSTSSAKNEARAMLAPLIEHLDHGCLGSVSEVFDGDAPHEARGCFAQAWSVAELLRAYEMTGP